MTMTDSVFDASDALNTGGSQRWTDPSAYTEISHCVGGSSLMLPALDREGHFIGGSPSFIFLPGGKDDRSNGGSMAKEFGGSP